MTFLSNENTDKKYLLFTSSGDSYNKILDWTINKEYDICVHYYGNKNIKEKPYYNKIDYYYVSKGWKFNILNYMYKNNLIDLTKYSYIAVFDDDIIISSTKINNLFNLCEKNYLYFGAPCFLGGKISHQITKKVNGSKFRYVNFIEVNVPIIKTDILIDILKEYNNELLGYGFDYYMLKKYYNLKDRKKNLKHREIILINNDNVRINKHNEMIKKGVYKVYKHLVYRTIKN